MKRYAIESKRCSGNPEPEWCPVFGAEFVDLEDAEREWNRLDDLHGHDTYHRLVEVKRKVLREA